MAASETKRMKVTTTLGSADSVKNHELSSWSPVPPIADNLYVNLTWKFAILSQQLACQLDHAICWQLETCQLEH